MEGHYVGPNGGKEEPVTGKEPAAPGGHTPEEEAAHNKSLETAQRIEKERTAAQRAVEEDETRVEGGTSIRKTEEKVCYESGKTSEECKSPAHKRELEAEAVAKREREVASGELTVHE